MLQVLTFLRSDCELKIGDESASCFTVLPSQLEVVLKGNHTQIPQKYAHKLVSTYPQSVASGIPKEFLRPGSTMLYIPGGTIEECTAHCLLQGLVDHKGWV